MDFAHNRQKYGIYEKHHGNTRFDIWFEGNGLAPTSNKYCDLNVTPTRGVMDDKCDLQYVKLKIHNRIYSNVSFSNTSPKISHFFQGIRHYIVNLLECCVCSIIRYWHHGHLI